MKDISIAEIMRLLSSHVIRYDKIKGYFIGDRYTKARVDDTIIVINNKYWNIKTVHMIN